MNSPRVTPETINFLVAGGETNPIYATTDYVYYKTISVDKWISKAGIKHDERPLRMPVGVTCTDSSCGIH